MENKLNFFVQIFQQIADPIGIFSLDDKLIDNNPAFEKMFGYTKDELKGKDFPGHKDYDEGLYEHWVEKCSSGEVITNFITKRKAKDGTVFFVNITVSPIMSLDNVLQALCLSYRDITELLTNRIKLQFQDTLMKNMHDAVIVTDITTTIIAWNKAAERIYGFSDKEAIGKDLSNFTKTEIINTTFEEIVSILETQGLWRGVIKQYTKRGKLLYIDSMATWVLDSSGDRIGMVAVNRDITNIRISEDKIINSEIEKTTILDNQSDLIVLQDLNNRIVWANKAALIGAGIGLTSAKDRYCFDIWGDCDAPCTNCSIEKVKISYKSEIFERTDKNGTTWSIKGTPIFDKDGKLYRILEAAEDITELKANELRIADNEAKYRNLVRAAPIGIVVIQDLKPVFCNPKALELFEMSDFEAFANSDFNDYLHPDDIDYVKKYAGLLPELTDEPFQIRFRIITKSGNLKHLISTTSFFTVGGESFYQSLIIDNTEITELNAVQKNLAVESIYMNQKNKLIEELSKQYHNFVDKYNILPDDKKRFEKVLHNYFQPERDWMVSKSHFEAVHKDFFSNLKNNFPKLTQNELRHCAYIRMNYTTKEIARIFNIEPSSIQKARLRLKKKMDLSQLDDLYMYIMTI